MANQEKKKFKGSGKKESSALPFVRQNYLLFGLGLFTIVLGYVFLSMGPWDSFWSLTLAPVLLVLGYCVIIPVAILFRKKEKQAEQS